MNKQFISPLKPAKDAYAEITDTFRKNYNKALNKQNKQDNDNNFITIAKMIRNNDNPRKDLRQTTKFRLTQPGYYYPKNNKDFYDEEQRKIQYKLEDFTYLTKKGTKIVSYPIRKDGVDYVQLALNKLYERGDLREKYFRNGEFTEDFISYLNDVATDANRKGTGIKDVFNRLRGKITNFKSKDTKDLTKRLNDLADMINKYNAKAEKQEQRLNVILREIDDIRKHDKEQDTELEKLNKTKEQPISQSIPPRPSFLNDIPKPSQLKPVEPKNYENSSSKKPNVEIPEWQKILNERRKDIEPDEPEDEESEDWGAGVKRMSLKEYLEMIN